MLFPKKVQWRISAAWATKQHDCTLHGIKTRCGGCCHSKKWWPPAAFNNPDGVCGYLGPVGCTLTPEDKPVKCHLYPFLVSKHGLIHLHFRWGTAKTWGCTGNHGNGPMLLDALKDNFVHLFGTGQFDRVRKQVLTGEDSYFDVPDNVARDFEVECLEESSMIQIAPRSKRKWPPISKL